MNMPFTSRAGTSIAAVFALITATSAAAAAQPPATAPATVVMKRHVVRDKGMGDMESHAILAPAGWRVEGGAWWPPPALFAILPSQDVKVIAPDGRMVHVGYSLGATDYIPSPQARQQFNARRPEEGGVDKGTPIIHLPGDLAAWRAFVEAKAFRATFPTATKLRVEPVVVVPELTTLLRRQLEPIRHAQAAQNQQMQAFGGMAGQGSVDGAVLAATAHYDLDGKSWEHMIVFGTVQVGLESQLGRQIWWGVEPVVSYRAEQGQLRANLPLMMGIANSLQPMPEWAKMRADHAAKMTQISAKGAADRSRILAASNREIGKIITDGYEQRQASQDRTHDAFIKSIREVEDYTAPGTSTPVQLPSHYGHVYGNSAGEYILTNDANYNPNTDPAVNNKTWETMQPVK